MTTRTATYPAIKNANAKRIKWTGLLNGDVGDGVEYNQYGDRSVQVTGTFGAGGSVSLKGSNDGGTTWVVLTDPQGNALTFTAAGLEAVSEFTQLIRPEVTAGDGTTSLTVNVFVASSGMK